MPIRLESPPPTRFDDTELAPDARKGRHGLGSSTPAGKVLIFTFLAGIISILFCRLVLWNNPHSLFFDGDRAYKFRYTAHRMEEGRKYLALAGASEEGLNRSSLSYNQPVVCAAMVTVKRDQVQYLNDTVGSMLADLTPEERSAIDIRLLFADISPQIHPDWNDTWLHALDWWGTYNVSEEQMQILREYKARGQIRAKGIFDYTYMLQQCYNTSAPYIALFEDDIVFAEGWVSKTLDALATVRDKVNWLYLRLFYTEIWMAWDKDVDPWFRNPIFQYVMSMFACYAIATGIAVSRWKRDHSDNHSRYISVMVFLCVTIPAFMTLTFAAKPLIPGIGKGISRMDTKGCCTQALVFPRERVPQLMEWLRAVDPYPTDMLIEEYADKHKYARYAISPQLVQHIGLVSTRGLPQKYTQMTFAFNFEGQDIGNLHKEHRSLARWGVWREEHDSHDQVEV